MERAEKFGVTAWGIGKALKRLGYYTYKKTYFHPKADEILRKEFQEKIEKYQEEGKVIVYIDSEVFYTWLKKDLIPKLPKESIIVMDNATFHKRTDMKEIIQKNNHILLFLPPYSPDLNPIEHKWSEAKSIRRKVRYSVDELFIDHMTYINLE